MTCFVPLRDGNTRPADRRGAVVLHVSRTRVEAGALRQRVVDAEGSYCVDKVLRSTARTIAEIGDMTSFT